MNTSCEIPDKCNFWFCKNKNTCLLQKEASTPLRFLHKKKVKTKVKNKKPKNTPNREQWKHHPRRVVTLIVNGHEAACACCHTLKNLTFDHIIPLSKGGVNSYKNGQILCVFCNQVKGDKIIKIEKLRILVEHQYLKTLNSDPNKSI